MKYFRTLCLPILCFSLIFTGCTAADRQSEETERREESGRTETSVHSDLQMILDQDPEDTIDFTYDMDTGSLIRWKVSYSEPVLSVREVEVTEEDIRNETETFLSDYKVDVPVTGRTSQESDLITVSLTGVWDGKMIYEESHVEFPIGSSGMPEAFDKSLEGVKTGDTVSTDVEYPEDYAEEDLRKQTVHFEIQVLDLKTVSMPDYTDAWIRVNTDYESIEEFEEAIRLRKREENIKTALWQWIASGTELISCPNELLQIYQNEEIRRYTDIARYEYDMDFESLLEKMGYTSETDFLKDNDSDIRQLIKIDMAVFNIVQEEKLTATAGEYLTYLRTFAEEFGCKDVDELLDIYTEKEMRQKFMEQLVYRWLSDHVVWRSDTES